MSPLWAVMLKLPFSLVAPRLAPLTATVDHTPLKEEPPKVSEDTPQVGTDVTVAEEVTVKVGEPLGVMVNVGVFVAVMLKVDV